MAFLYLYSLAGFACLKLVTPDFGLLANTEYRLEGAFRYVACSKLVTPGMSAAAGVTNTSLSHV